MILTNKNAVIYGAGGSLGGAVAKALAAAGAKVFATGRNRLSVQATADEILAAGGWVQVDEVDALDETAVNTHLDKVIAEAGSIDISFNAIGYEVVQNIPLVTMQAKDFLQPINTGMHTQFLTCIAAAKRMNEKGTGVILTLTATPGGIGYPLTSGFAPLCAAVETFTINLASECGVFGTRVVNIRSGGSPDSRVFREAVEKYPDEMETVLSKMKQDTMLKKMPSMADIANTAVFLCSGMAANITGCTIDLTGGTTQALNYRATSPRDQHTIKDGHTLAGI